MTTMVERIGKRIYEKRNGAGCRPWSILTKSHKAPYLDDARAALEEMKVPTAEMLNATETVIDSWDYQCQMCGGPKETYMDMITAIMAERKRCAMVVNDFHEGGRSIVIRKILEPKV